MSSFSNAPKLLKGAIVGIDKYNFYSSIIPFQYNPDEISRSIEPQYAEASGEALRLAGPPRETISATVELDATDRLEQNDERAMGDGLHPELAGLEMLLYPKSAQVLTSQVLLAAGVLEVIPPEIPLTLFIYGWKRVVPVKMMTLSVTEKAHDTRLNPILAEVSLSMKVLNYQDLSAKHPGYWTFLTHQAVKETLASIAGFNDLGTVLGESVDASQL